MNTQKVWFVTGASKGLGLALVKELLAGNYNVAATSRDIKELKKAVGSSSASFLPLQVDLVNEKSVSDAVGSTLATFGRVDVIVNNAGYGQLGAIEELSDEEARRNFDANVFGVLNVMRSVMPHFRERKAGHVINISSIAGFLGSFPGWGIYNATKFAVAGLTEAFSAEAKEFGVHATIVYPGYFRTNFLLQGSLKLAASQVDAYAALREMERVHQQEIPGNQPGSPEKAAKAFIRLAEMEQPPLHLFLGSDSFGLAGNKIQQLQEELAGYESMSRSSDF